MADIEPLRALRYDLARTGGLDAVAAPPYDVIDADQRAALLAKSPYNVVELDLPQAPGDPYAHAASTLAQWLADGVLVREQEPTLWAVEQDYTGPDGVRRTRRGIFARVRVVDYGPGLVRPHERTHPGPKEDRLRLTRATKANLSPIFSLYDDPDGAAWRAVAPHVEGEPFGATTDEDGTAHRLHRIADADAIAAVQEALADKELLIADGHHRYETARVYAEEIGGEGGHRYVLMCLVALQDPGLTVFPTHRLIDGLDDAKRTALRTAIERDWDVEPLASPARAAARAGGRRPRPARLLRHVPPPAATADAARRAARRRGAARARRALPPPRHRRAGSAAAAGGAGHERGRHLPLPRHRLRTLERRGAAADRVRRPAGGVLHGRDTGQPRPRRRRRGRDDAAQVDLLLPQGPDRTRLQPAGLMAGPPPPRDRNELAAAVRELLLSAQEAEAIDVHGRTDAGVLVPLYLQDGAIHAVFTKRRDDLRRHAGEISFPGGRRDPGEDDLRDTALREAEEEIGLPRENVELVGALPPTPTFVTSYAIYPHVGVIDAGTAWEIEAAEVDRVLELSLADVRDGYALKRMVRRGLAFRTDTYTVDGNMIWGATARIVGDLLARLKPLL